MNPLSPNASVSVTNVLRALGEFDQARSTETDNVPPFANAPTDSDSASRYGTMASLCGESSATAIRGTLLDALHSLLVTEGLPTEFAALAVESLRGANPAAAGPIRNRIQRGLGTLATRLEGAESNNVTQGAELREARVTSQLGADFEALGWSRLGDSNYWKGPEAIGMAKPGKPPVILNPYKVTTDKSVTGVKLSDRNAYFCLRADKDNDHGFREINLSGGLSHVNYVSNDQLVQQLQAHFADIGPTESLRASGFMEVADGVFELSVGDDHDRYDLLAVVEGGQIAGLYKGDTRKTHPFWRGSEFRVIGVGAKDYGETPCEIENETMGVRFWTSGHWIKDVSLLKPLDTYTPKDLQIGAEYLPHTEETGFAVGGRNSNEIIRSCLTFNSHPVEELEAKMRPAENVDHEMSIDGFLGEREDLREEMAFQNDFVLETRGSSHQEVVKHLRFFQAAERLNVESVVYHGVEYRIRKHPAFGGPQGSPFGDGSGGGGGFYLSPIHDPDKEILVSPTAIDMIERWGFYEGRSCEWHLNPQVLFDILAPAFANDRSRPSAE